MAMYSSKALEKQARDLNAQILAALAAAEIKAELDEDSAGIKIPEYHFNILSISEPYSGSTWSRNPSGRLEVDFRSIHTGMGCLCHAKRFKIDAKDLIKKVVASVKERRDALIARAKRDKEKDKAIQSHQKVLKAMKENYPEFSGNIEHHKSQINLNFHHLTEDQARMILVTLRNAGIKGVSAITDDIDFSDED
jgi:hypothetical protein